MDVYKLVGIIDNHLGMGTLKQSVTSIEGRVGDVESKFFCEEGTINLMHS